MQFVYLNNMKEETPKTLDELSQQAGVNTADVKTQQEKFGSLSNEAAIGGVAMKKPVGVISSKNAINTVNAKKQFLDEVGQFQTTSKKNASNEIINPTQQDVSNFNQQFTTERPQEPTGSKFTLEEATQLFGKDFTGLTQTQDGNFIADSSALARVGIQGLEQDKGSVIEGQVTRLNNQIESLVSEFDSYNVNQDPDFIAQSNVIKQQYERLRQDMERKNASRQRALETLGIRSGAARYAGSVQLGIEGEELKQAGARLSEIEAAEAQALSDARVAFKEQAYTDFVRKVDSLETLRKNKAEELKNYNDKLTAAADALQKQQDFEMSILDYQLKLRQQGFAEMQFESNFGLDIAKFENDKATTARQFGLDEQKLGLEYNKFSEDIRQFGINTAMDKLKLEIEQSNNAFDREYKFQTLLSETPAGLEISIGGMTGTGRKKVDDLSISEKISLAEKGYVVGENGELKKKVNQGELDNAKEVVNQMSSLGYDESGMLDVDKGLDVAVGPNLLARYSPLEWFSSKKSNFVASVEQLVSQESLNSLVAAKARGATFGALSDTEMGILRSAATKINNWAVHEDNDPTKKVIGYETTQEEFMKELNTIREKAQNIIRMAEQEQGESILDAQEKIDQFYLQNPDQRSYIDQLEDMTNPNTGKPFTDQEKLEILGISFSQPGTGANDGAVSVSIPKSSRLAYVNNNPGNLRYIGQSGASQGEGGFARFESPEAGWQALVDDIKAKQTGNTRTGLGPDSTLKDLVYVYAPPSENDSDQYVQQIAKLLGVSTNTKISQISTRELAKVIAQKESSTKIG